MRGGRRFYGVATGRSIYTMCPHRCVMNNRGACRRAWRRSKTSRRTLGLRKGGYNQQDRGSQPESALHFHGCLPFFHNMRRPHHRRGCTILGQLIRRGPAPRHKIRSLVSTPKPSFASSESDCPPRNNDLRCFSRYAGCAINVRPKGVRIWLRNTRFRRYPLI
jgi:hypothetical protein